MRTAKITRTTAETQITIDLNLDGTGTYDSQAGVGFFDHMLDQLARHAMFDLTVRAKGDHHIDDHHTVEDTGIALGQALVQAVGDKKGIQRYGSCLLPIWFGGSTFQPSGLAALIANCCANFFKP